MRFKFEKPTGSQADTKELEYIAALMQTCRPLRQDGSIEGTLSCHGGVPMGDISSKFINNFRFVSSFLLLLQFKISCTS